MPPINHRPRRRSPDDAIGGPNNQLRVDLYRRLIPQIQQQDQASGAQGYVIHWNDPDAQWNKEDDIRSFWNAVGSTSPTGPPFSSKVSWASAYSGASVPWVMK